MVYSVQTDRKEKLRRYSHAPALLRNERIKDVTAEYFGHNMVEIPVDTSCGSEAYLGIFTPSGFKAVDFGETAGSGKAKFTDLEPELIYFPLAYSEMKSRIVPCGDAFMLGRDGSVSLLFPDTSATRTVRLVRKMPLRPQLVEWMESGIVGCRIEGSDDVRRWTTLYEFDKPVESNYHIVDLDRSKSYRYYRIVPPSDICLQLAEIEFFSDTDSLTPMEMPICSPIDEAEAKAVDGDLLTYYIFSPDRYRIMFRNLSGKTVKSVALSVRNDDNYVWPGQEYELLYYDRGEWRTCGRRVATGHSLEFDAPANAVLWLRNLTKGREEQVFVYRDGRQLFNMDLRTVP